MTMGGTIGGGGRGHLAAGLVAAGLLAIVVIAVVARPPEPAEQGAVTPSSTATTSTASTAPPASPTEPRYGEMATARVTQGFRLSSQTFAGTGQSILVIGIDPDADPAEPAYLVQHWGDLDTGIRPDTTLASVPVVTVDGRTTPYEPACVTSTTDVAEVGALQPFERLLCYGSRDLTLEPVRVESYAVMNGNPPWLAGPAGVDFLIAIPFDPTASVTLPSGVWLEVTGHFDDPACDLADVRCRERFVVTASRGADAPASELPGTWTTISPSPLGGRSCPASVWTDAGFFIWGGQVAPDPETGKVPPTESDGALYDPAADTWRTVSDAPLGTLDCPRAAWTGSEVLVLGGWSGPEPQRRGAAYDPAADRWRSIADVPIQVDAIVWADDRLVAVGPLGVAASYDPQRDRWTTLPSAEAPPGWQTSLLWTGGEVLLFVAVDGIDTTTLGYRLSWNDEAWRPTSPSPQWALFAGTMVWTGTEVIGLAGAERSDSGRSGSAAYEPATDTWRELPACPIDTSYAVWTGRGVLSYGGAFDTAPEACLTLPVAPPRGGPEATTGREFFAFAWTGTQYLAWSGGTGSDRIYYLDDGVIFTPTPTGW